MRMAIVSDIHGNLVALEAVLADLGGRGVDVVVNLGDCVTAPLWPRETLELLITLQWPTVRGNHDRWLVDTLDLSPTARRSQEFAHDRLTPAQRQHLFDLPSTLLVDDTVLAVHGTPGCDTQYLLEDAMDDRLCAATEEVVDSWLGGATHSVVLCGHSHHARIVMTSHHTLVINPGSVGCPRSADHPRWRNVEASGPLARYAIATESAGRWSVELIALPYDWSAVVRCATRNGRPDWADGFLGYPTATA